MICIFEKSLHILHILRRLFLLSDLFPIVYLRGGWRAKLSPFTLSPTCQSKAVHVLKFCHQVLWIVHTFTVQTSTVHTFSVHTFTVQTFTVHTFAVRTFSVQCTLYILSLTLFMLKLYQSVFQKVHTLPNLCFLIFFLFLQKWSRQTLWWWSWQ